MPSRFLSKHLVLALHRDLIDSFGGTQGIRDEGLLDSALAQPMASGAGRLLHRTLHEQAAAYLFHLCSNHPFVDGNKRLAFAAVDVFLRVNGFRLTLSDEDAYQLTMKVARGQIRKRAVLATIRAASERI